MSKRLGTSTNKLTQLYREVPRNFANQAIARFFPKPGGKHIGLAKVLANGGPPLMRSTPHATRQIVTKGASTMYGGNSVQSWRMNGSDVPTAKGW